MRTKKQLRTFRMEAAKIKQLFLELSNSITSGQDSVWIREERNGDISFLVGNKPFRMSEAALKEGGLL